MELRQYQKTIAREACSKIKELGIIYLALQTRVGKTLTALHCAQLYGAKNVLFVTKLKAIGSIESDFEMLKPDYNLTVINFESVSKKKGNYDFAIIDESHSCLLGSTLINGEKISSIKIGGTTKSFNFALNKHEDKKILNVYRNKLNEDLIKIKCDGKEIICTRSHKIHTKRGWKEAGEITIKDELQMVR
jgi:hypothetical protein